MAYYEKVNKDSKKGLRLIASTIRFDGRTLSDCYTRYSGAKEAVYNCWLKECYSNLNGENFRIISHNSNFFSLAFEAGNDLYVITPSHNYCIVDALA